MNDNFLEISREQGVIIASFRDRISLDDKNIEDFRRQIDSAISGEMGVRLLLDMSQVQYLSSVILGAMISISKQLQNQDGVLKLCGAQESVAKVFKLTRLDRIFQMLPSRNEGLKAFSHRDKHSV